MQKPIFKQLAVIGCGLMGGSLALALKRAGMVESVVGYSKSPSTTERAMKLKVIDRAAVSALEAVSGSDVIVLAVPISAMEASMKSIEPLLSKDMLLMDVGSTKQDVIATAKRVLKDKIGCFVPAHPIAGSEKSSVEAATPDLYQERLAILTPLAQTLTRHLSSAKTIWEAVGAQVRLMSPHDHDETYAAVSHLPHLIAFAYMLGIEQQPKGHAALEFAGPGFRDFSRIAASDAHIWRDILLGNRKELIDQLAHFRVSLNVMERLIKANDTQALLDIISNASKIRKDWRMPTDVSEI